jgi:ElaB/YqjD/DUF883 family membrane-anchored ribosome-binding protein
MVTKATVTTSTTEGRGTLAHGVDQATAGAHDTINSVSDAARPAVDRMAINAHELVDKVSGLAGLAAETLGARGEQLNRGQQKALGSAREYLHQHPLASLGIAMATGYILSRLFSAR